MHNRTKYGAWAALGPALLAAMLWSGCGGGSEEPAPAEEVVVPEVEPGELLVGVRAGSAGEASLEAVINSVGDVLSINSSVYRIRLHDGVSSDAAQASLVHNDILYTEPNYVVRAYAAPTDDYWTSTAGPQYGDTVKAQIEYAWDHWTSDGTYTGVSPLLVALLDTGVTAGHAQFASKARLDLVNAKNEITQVTGEAAVADDNGHGTACASIIAGAQNSTIGAGTGMLGMVSWNGLADPGIVQVIPYKVLDANGKGNHANVARGINDAVAAGAKIISMSFGGVAPSWTLQHAIEDAKTAGVLVIAAAGNDASSIKRYPAGYQSTNQLVLSVGSVDSTDSLSPDSNYGSWVNVLAPGVSVNAVGSTAATGLWAASHSDTAALTQSMTGTSLSAAWVSGAAAMIWAQTHTLTAAQVRKAIIANVDSYNRAGTKAIATGSGRVNVRNALGNSSGIATRVLGSVIFPATKAASAAGAITGTVTLANAQGTATTVALSSDNAALVVPASVTVAANATSATFTATVGAVAADATATVTATSGLETATGVLLLKQPAIASVKLAKSSLAGGTSTTGTVTLNAAAPKPDGMAITLSVSGAGSASVHFASASITVAGGATTANFTITTDPVATSKAATITATDANANASSCTLTLTPPTVSRLTLDKTTVTFGTVTGTVTLSAAAPVGGQVVTLASSDGLVAVPASMTVAAGETTGTFTITPEPATESKTVSITATIGSSSKSVSLKVMPPLKSLAISATSIMGAGTATATVTLNDNTPADVAVAIASDSGRVTFTGLTGGNITVATGAKTATFTVNVAAGTTSVAANVTATYQGVVATKVLTAAAPTLSSFTCTPATVNAGNTVTCTATLSAAAPVNMDVTIASTNETYLPLPSTVTVASGTTSKSFTVTTGMPAAATSYTYTATVNSTSKTAAVRVSPSGVTLSSVALDNATRVGGLQTATGTVTLSGNAPTGGILVTLASAQTGIATVPASVTVSAGASTATFTVTTKAQAADAAPFNITASYGGSDQTAALTVTKTIATVLPDVVSLPNATSIVGQTVTLGAANGSGSAMTVTLSLVDASNTANACSDVDSSVTGSVTVANASSTSGGYTVANANTGAETTCKVKASVTIAGVTVSGYSGTITLEAIAP